MKFKRSDVVRGCSRIPEIRCENDDEVSLTSFAGLVIFQNLFSRHAIKQRLHACFAHLRRSATYRGHEIVLWLILHLILGFRKLRDRDYYQHDPMAKRVPHAALEARVDSALFDEGQLVALDRSKVEFTASVPFARFPKLKGIIESRKRWRRIDATWSYFECDWKPARWAARFRILVIRQKKAVPIQGPLQLDLFEPRSHEYDYQVIITNKGCSAKRVMAFHHGRGSQEGLFAEAKQFFQMEYIPVRTLCGNQVYCLSAVMAHNLTRELQIEAYHREHGTTAKRRSLWVFETLGTLRNRILRRAGRLIRPQGRLTLVIPAGEKLREELELYTAG